MGAAIRTDPNEIDIDGARCSPGHPSACAVWHCGRGDRVGWTLIELLLVVAIIGTLAALAIPYVNDAIDRANVARATGDILAMEDEIAGFQITGDSLPASLAGIGRANFLDPWGNPYQYLRISGRRRGGLSQARKDRFLVPINSDYDLYSMGKDGQSQLPLTAKVSRDDVVRANDGGYVGLAARY